METIAFHGGVQVMAAAGRDWVPKDDYDRLSGQRDIAVSALKECREHWNSSTVVREIATDVLVELGELEPEPVPPP